MENQEGTNNGSAFWKTNAKAVPGRPSPRKELKPSSGSCPSTSSSFQDFQQTISDAWDLGDDEFCSISNLKISRKTCQGVGSGDVTNIHKNSAEYKNKYPGKAQSIANSKQPVTKKDSQLNLTYSELDLDNNKIKKFKALITAHELDLKELQNLSWPGIPFPVKADTWRLLSSYASSSFESREEILQKKRSDYWSYVKKYYDSEIREEVYQSTYRQIHIDIPRMSPTIRLFRQKTVQEMFERILFIWSVMHPASGYVQGINDLVTPFYIVFLQQVVPEGADLDDLDIMTVSCEDRNIIEADSYWCFCRFLDGIQDNYIFPQHGIQEKIIQLRELIQRIDQTLHQHLQSNGIEYLQFSFRWMNNLLTRELPLRCLIRLWDTYLAELDTFASFQTFVCAAFLLHWRRELMLKKDFQGLMLMLQNLPTQNWNDKDICLLVAEAYKLKFAFADAPKHFKTSQDS